MIDPQIIEMLDSSDVEERKQAIKALAKSKDREALTYLADVYRFDDDNEVRELARKAGIYIRNNTSDPGESASPASRSSARQDRPAKAGSFSAASVGAASLYADDDDEEEEEEDSTPLPSQIQVSKVDIDRAQGYLNQAMDMNIRGDNRRAVEYLNRAVQSNPRLMHDSYAISLASTITGMDGREALKRLGSGAAATRSKKDSASAVHSGLQVGFAMAMMLAAIVALAGYFVLPWVDIGKYEDPTTGQTVEDSFALLELGLGALPNRDLEQFAREAGLPLRGDILKQAGAAFFDDINLAPTGFSTTSYAVGQTNVFDYFGLISAIKAAIRVVVQDPSLAAFGAIDAGELDSLIDQSIDEFGSVLLLEPDPVDYSLLLLPLAAAASFALGFLLVLQVTISRWFLVIVVGLIGLIPVLYFYTQGLENLIASSLGLTGDLLATSMQMSGMSAADLRALGAGDLDMAAMTQLPADFSALDLVGMGFWVSAAGMAAVALLPFIALLLMPEPESK